MFIFIPWFFCLINLCHFGRRFTEMFLSMKILSFFILFALVNSSSVHKRSIDLIQAHGLISDSRLPLDITPSSYDLELQPFLEEGTFKGKIKISATWVEETNEITLHADANVQITDVQVKEIDDGDEQPDSSPTPTILTIAKTESLPKKTLFVIHLEKHVVQGTQCEIELFSMEN
ncbi:hypothetical protein WA026_005466 [Henosepilachna vigintioctopunctata]|uniref:Aminopeptidase N-like N-terminal domain-containing protein n=1 Tax=Henosepilachna vigintioctopunctata TaxID=420089 RepID=A0AAW1U398_9CUCU